MWRHPRSLLLALWVIFGDASHSLGVDFSLAQQPWVEVSTAHFNLYGCGPLTGLYKVATRLEQFSSAYGQLAGAQAVESPPITVLVFADETMMKPFLPLYQGAPANLAGFFQRGLDENLIVLSLPQAGTADADFSVIFHEYAHFLFRRNDQIWPLWLKEGMAEVYSTFQTSGRYARIANPIEPHLRLLTEQPLMSLRDLFAVTEDSPQYNEAQRQGLFYAESWLLTHFLMSGAIPQYRARFGQFTTLLHQGEPALSAFTNALQTTLPVVQAGLRWYLARGVFPPIDLRLAGELTAPIAAKVSRLPPAETYFRLGDELLRCRRGDDAEPYFEQAAKLAPASPQPEEGLGLLAARRDQHADALQHFQKAIALGSENFLVYYSCAQEKFRATGDAENRHTQIPEPAAAEIRGELGQAIRLMPDYAPAHELLGFFEMVQGEHLAVAGQQLLLAIQLAPQNHSYLISLAQFQIQTRNSAAARQTLQSLMRPDEAPELRTQAQDLLNQLNHFSRSAS